MLAHAAIVILLWATGAPHGAEAQTTASADEQACTEVATLGAGRGRVCVRLAMRAGRPVVLPEAVFLQGGLPAKVDRGRVLRRLEELLAKLSATCEGDGNTAGPCVVPGDAALRACAAVGQDANAVVKWEDYWTRISEVCGADMQLLDRLRTVFGALAPDSPFVLDAGEASLETETGILRLEVIALMPDTPIRVRGPLGVGVREAALRRALRAQAADLWDGPRIEQVLRASLAPAPATVFAGAQAARIDVIEAPQVRDIVLPAFEGTDAALAQRSRMQALYLLLNDRDFRRWLVATTATGAPPPLAAGQGVQFVRDLGYAPGAEPFWSAVRQQRSQLALGALGLTLDPQPAGTQAVWPDSSVQQSMLSLRVLAPAAAASAASAASGAAPADAEQAPPERKPRFIGVQIERKPGQGTLARAVLKHDPVATRWADLAGQIRAGPGDGSRGSASVDLAADYIAFDRLQRRLAASTSWVDDTVPGRRLQGAERDERRRGQHRRVELEPFRDRDGQAWLLHLAHADVDVSTRGPAPGPSDLRVSQWTLGTRWRYESAASLRPWHVELRPEATRAREANAALRYRKSALELDAHAQLERSIELDVRAAAMRSSTGTPLQEQPTLGGAQSVRGFIADSTIGAELDRLQTELWFPWPQALLGRAGDTGTLGPLLAKTRLALVHDVGVVRDAAPGYEAGTRHGTGVGLRLLFAPAVLKLDVARGGGRTRLYFDIRMDFGP